MNRFLAILVVLSVVATLTHGFAKVGQPCSPAAGASRDQQCFPGSVCSLESQTCICADSPDGRFKRVLENGECKLVKGSKCVPRVDQEFYRCGQGTKCTETRKGQDVSKCPADAPCDIGDHNCL